MRDTSTLFKLCVKALLELSADDVKLLMQLACVLHVDTYGLNPLVVSNMPAPEGLKPGRIIRPINTAPYDYGGEAYKSVMRERRKRKKAAKSKASKRNVSHAKPSTIVDKVWSAMKASSGELTTIELAEILELKRVQVASAINALHEKHPIVLKRRWVKGTYDTDKNVRIPGYYMWQYAGKTT